jgi:hypothetical protein
LEIYLTADQDPNGGFGYTSPGGNVARTGAGIACLAWIGAPVSDPRVASAIGFIDNNWAWDNMGNLYAMYAVMKGMRGFEPNIEMLGSRDWYAAYADFLIQNQDNDGSWTSDVWYGRDLSTASGVLILTPEVFVSPPVAVAKAAPTEASPGTVITFDHSASFHRDPLRTLTAFRWNFNEDDIWDYATDDINAKPTHIYDDQIVCGEEVEHLAVLEVEDDVGNTDKDDETVTIRINLKNHPPVADGDPTDSVPNYVAAPGGRILLNASQSYDPDEPQGDFITSWEWDLDGDQIFDASGEKLLFRIPDNWLPDSTHTVTLRVTDDGSWASACGGVPNLIDETTITIYVSDAIVALNVEIKPETLNLESHGKFTAFITLPADSGYSLSDMDPDSLICEGAPVYKTMLAEKKLIAKFKTADLVGVSPGSEVPMVAGGYFYNGFPCEGIDIIRVIAPQGDDDD